MDEDFLDLIDQEFLEGQIDGETSTGGFSFSECCDANPGHVLPEISGNVLSSVNSCARKKLNCEKSLTTEKARLPRIRFTHDEWIKFALFDREYIFGDFRLSHCKSPLGQTPIVAFVSCQRGQKAISWSKL